MTNRFPDKGNKVNEFIDDYCVIDIETTGLSSDNDSILEISLLRYRDNKLVDKFSRLVKQDDPIDPYITNLTGISDDMVKDADDIETVLNEFHNFINDDDVIIGHNVHFDINFIYTNMERYLGLSLTNDYIDTLYISRKLLTDMKHHRLNDLVDRFNLNNEHPHRATADCLATMQIYIKLRKLIFERYNNEHVFFKKERKLKEIIGDPSKFEPNHKLYKKHCVITGKFSILQDEVRQIIADIGGINDSNVKKATDIVIVSKKDSHNKIREDKSSKEQKAEQDGKEIIYELDFYDLIREYY